MLITLASVQMAVDRRMRVFPDLEERIRGVLVICQRQIVFIQLAPGTLRIEGGPLSLGKQDVRLEGIFIKAVNSSANLSFLLARHSHSF